jgi:hypothetical protein
MVTEPSGLVVVTVDPFEPRFAAPTDEPDTPLPVCTVTDEPPGMLVDPDRPSGPVVTLLDGPHRTTRHSLLVLPSLVVVVTTVEPCDPVPVAALADELPCTAAHGFFSCGSAFVAKAGEESAEIASTPLAASVTKEEELACFMVVCL